VRDLVTVIRIGAAHGVRVMHGVMLATLVCLLTTRSAGSESQLAGRNQSVRIGVLSLFRPSEIHLKPCAGQRIDLNLDGQRFSLRNDTSAISMRAVNSQIEVQFGQRTRPETGALLRAQDASRFWLEVPGKLRRQYEGILEMRAHGDVLEAIVTMPIETAVASIVQAESPVGAGLEALKAQAVAARSFLTARQSSHLDFDFCDTTHCQFLRAPPAVESAAAHAAKTTRGLILSWHDAGVDQDRPLAAMYARSCGGHTRTLREIGIRSTGYPYYRVRCTFCIRHPEVWQRDSRKLPPPESEAGRLAFNRIYGWSAFPRLPTSADAQKSEIIAGHGIGHGLGLCQLGAASMAHHGASFAEILAHYYPNTRLTAMQ